MKEDNISLELVYDRICSNIYNQLLLVEQNHPIKRIDADLMMEQSVVCGLLGYHEFLSLRRLNTVLQWQRTSGCYGDIENVEDFPKTNGRQTMRKLLMKKELSGERFGKTKKLVSNGMTLFMAFEASTIQTENPEIPVGKSNGTHHSIRSTSKIMALWSK